MSKLDSTSTSTPTSTNPASESILTPTSSVASFCDDSHDSTQGANSSMDRDKSNMETARADQGTTDEVQLKREDEPNADSSTGATADAKAEPTPEDPKAAGSAQKKKKKSVKCKKHGGVKSKHIKKKSKKARDDTSDSSSDSSSSSSDSDSDEEDDSSSTEEEKSKRKGRKKKAAKRAAKNKKHKRSKHHDSSSDDSSSDSSSDSSDSDSEDEGRRRRHRRSKKSKSKRRKDKRDVEDSDDEASSGDSGDTPEPDEPSVTAANIANLEAQLNALKLTMLTQQQGNAANKARVSRHSSRRVKDEQSTDRKAKKPQKKGKKGKKGSTLEYKRVDQLWDSTIHNYKLTESAEDQVDEFDEFIFTVRRKFDWENKYRSTVVDIKSKFLRDALQEVMKDVKGVSLVEEQPSVDPNMLFLYLDEMKAHRKKTLKARLKKEKKKKQKKRINIQMSHIKVLEGYLNEDYEETKKSLYPMLAAGNITFDLLWALFKPNTIAYCSTYGSNEDPRCFKVDYANKESSFMRGEWYSIEGRYLEYDGKNYGMGEFEMQVDSYKGPRKITSLSTYPLSYHKDPESMKKQLVERGKKFVSMQGMHYKFLKGLGFQKKKKAVAKVNISGRVMVDPAIFRRINPNYPISSVRNKLEDDLFGDSDDDSCSDCCGSDSDDDMAPGASGPHLPGEESERERYKYAVIKDRNQKWQVVQVPVDENGRIVQPEKLEGIEKDPDSESYDFSEEELLIASPVVLGFAFSEKLWLEFSLSAISDIEWNSEAFDSLVLPNNQKSIVKGMVSSHQFNAAKRIDDVVQGKGRGLVFVLHGPPGVGKTLTAEGIAEFLKCPLYSVSAGELGTDSRVLEHELQKIMDIAHSWGAVLLLDEADVFLEKREVHDIHRNALVSIFLRLLEYFQGILFLTTNRVETFDDAFQSRIHMPLRYGELTVKARKEIWKAFVERVKNADGMEVAEFTESMFSDLARGNLNGRQIKNAVRTAQSLALSENETFSVAHIRKVLEVTETFDHDLRGGTGYLDAMRSYT